MEKQCWLPYYHAEVKTDGSVFPCCKYKGPWLTNLEDYNTKDRTEFEQKELPNSCSNCKEVIHSYREIKMIDFRRKWKEPDKPNLRSLNFSIDNTCSNSCIMCNEQSSTTIAKLKNRYMKLSADFSNTDFSSLETLVITGGEPLQSKRLPELCEKLKGTNIKGIGVITSLSNIKEKNLIALESVKKPLSFRISVDGPLDLHGWIRGIKYHDWVINLNRIKLHSINWQITLGSYNVFALPETLDYIETLIPTSYIQPSIVYGPTLAFTIACMPVELKQKVRIKLLNYKTKNNNHYIVHTALELLNQHHAASWELCMVEIEEIARLRKDNRKLTDFINQYLS